MGYFGIPFRNGVPIGLGSVVSFGAQQFDPSELFVGGTAGAWYDPSDLTTLFTTSAGTTQCAMPGDGAAVSVGRMLDKSGNGNHAIAFNDTTARPELRARVNLLTYSEQFDNAAWSRQALNAFGSGSVANTTATLDPLGGNTADFIQESTAAGNHGVLRSESLLATQYTFSAYCKAATRSWAYIRLPNAGGQGAYFNLSNGTVGTVEAGTTATISDAGNGWYRCSVSRTTTAGTWVPQINIATGDNQGSYTGDGTSGIYIWGADLRPANIGANVPAYQRIADANTYDTSGFPLYLRFDGIDDSMYTPANLNLSGTDKVSVFAGVRKNDNTNAQAITELSAAANTNNGAFWVFTNLTAGGGASSAAYALATNGTAFAGAAATGTTAPITNVLSGALKISTGSDNTVLRVNGTQVATSGATSSGTGNFGSYPLFIGSRNNASAWLNGHLHSLIIAGSAVSAGNISATEQWAANKTGIVIP